MSRRQGHEEKHGNHERWLLTYADMITLLLALFILLYSISNVDGQKFQELAQKFGEYFNPSLLTIDDGSGGSGEPGASPGGSEGEEPGDSTGISGTSSTPPPLFFFPAKPGEGVDLDELQMKINDLIERNGLTRFASVHTEDRGVVLSLVEGMLFPSGSAKINDEAYVILYQLIDIIKSVENYIRVEGSTDNIPIKNTHFDDNWDLAAKRATNVARVLELEGVASERITVISYGEHRPVAPNDTEENRRLNRRVDVVFLNSEFNSSEAGSAAAPTPAPSP